MVDDWSAPFGVSDARSKERNERLVEEELGKCIVGSEEHLRRFRACIVARNVFALPQAHLLFVCDCLSERSWNGGERTRSAVRYIVTSAPVA